MVRRDGRLQEVPWEEALDETAKRLAGLGAGEIGITASGQSSCEDLFVLQRFAREVLKSEVTSAGSWADSAAAALTDIARAAGQNGPLNFRIADVGRAKTIMVFGEDLPVTQPIVGLEVHQALRNGASLIGVGTEGGKSTMRGPLSLVLPAAAEGLFLSALAAIVMKRGGAVCDKAGDLTGFKAALRGFDVPKALKSLNLTEERLGEIARLLTSGHQPLFLFGPAFLAAAGRRTLAILWNLAAITGGRLIPLDEAANVRGEFALFNTPTANRASAGSLAEALARKVVRALYLAGPFQRLEPGAAELVIFQGSYRDENAAAADVLVPETTSFETEGTLVNVEGRIQVSAPAVSPQGEARPGWSIVAALAAKMGAPGFAYGSAADVRRDLAASIPAFAQLAKGPGQMEELFLAEEAGEAGRYIDPASISVIDKKKERPCLQDPDMYKGLDLIRENKSLRLIRGR
jgi:predicted molibdopterin-dependent oxidoreductase YjgC